MISPRIGAPIKHSLYSRAIDFFSRRHSYFTQGRAAAMFDVRFFCSHRCGPAVYTSSRGILLVNEGRTTASVIEQYTQPDFVPYLPGLSVPSKRYADVIIPDGGFNAPRRARHGVSQVRHY